MAARRRRSARASRGALGAAVLGLLAVLLAAALPLGEARLAEGARPFTQDSAWNMPIPDDASVDPDSDAMVGHLAERGYANANLDAYGVPVYEADSRTPRHEVACTMAWGECDLEEGLIPIPDDARPSPGSDGAMVVVDRAAGRSYDFWRARRSGDGRWTAAWGGVVDLAGDGFTPGAAQTGAGVPRLAGVVRASEIERGIIPHALAVAGDNACRREYRYPASKTDGWSQRDDCIPEGARIQLDPRVDIDAIPGMAPAERTVARALQTYGAYMMDNAATRMAFIFETPAPAVDPYAEAGLLYDYHRLEHIPWEHVQVLRRWDGR